MLWPVITHSHKSYIMASFFLFPYIKFSRITSTAYLMIIEYEFGNYICQKVAPVWLLDLDSGILKGDTSPINSSSACNEVMDRLNWSTCKGLKNVGCWNGRVGLLTRLFYTRSRRIRRQRPCQMKGVHSADAPGKNLDRAWKDETGISPKSFGWQRKCSSPAWIWNTFPKHGKPRAQRQLPKAPEEAALAKGSATGTFASAIITVRSVAAKYFAALLLPCCYHCYHLLLLLLPPLLPLPLPLPYIILLIHCRYNIHQ